jgi:hypothetical protein
LPCKELENESLQFFLKAVKVKKIIKIGFFTDDFIKISSHPGRSAGLYIFEISGVSVLSGSKVVFNENDYVRAAPGGHCGCGRGKSPGHGCFRFKNGVIEINENIKKLNVGDSFYGCEIVFCGAIGYNLERKLSAAGVEIFLTGEPDIQKVLRSFLDGVLEKTSKK